MAAIAAAARPAPVLQALPDVNLEGLRLLRSHLLEQGPERRPPAHCEADEPGWAALVPLWRSLGDAALSRLADAPHLMFDAGFAEPDVWHAGSIAGVHDPAPARPRAGSRAAGGSGLCEGLAGTERGRQYASTLVLLAWQLAQGAPAAAVVVAGLSPEICSLFQGQGVHRIAALAGRAAPLLEPRWSRAPEFWRALLVAAAEDDAAALGELRIRAQKRLLGGALRANRRQFP